MRVISCMSVLTMAAIAGEAALPIVRPPITDPAVLAATAGITVRSRAEALALTGPTVGWHAVANHAAGQPAPIAARSIITHRDGQAVWAPLSLNKEHCTVRVFPPGKLEETVESNGLLVVAPFWQSSAEYVRTVKDARWDGDMLLAAASMTSRPAVSLAALSRAQAGGCPATAAIQRMAAYAFSQLAMGDEALLHARAAYRSDPGHPAGRDMAAAWGIALGSYRDPAVLAAAHQVMAVNAAGSYGGIDEGRLLPEAWTPGAPLAATIAAQRWRDRTGEAKALRKNLTPGPIVDIIRNRQVFLLPSTFNTAMFAVVDPPLVDAQLAVTLRAFVQDTTTFHGQAFQTFAIALASQEYLLNPEHEPEYHFPAGGMNIELRMATHGLYVGGPEFFGHLCWLPVPVILEPSETSRAVRLLAKGDQCEITLDGHTILRSHRSEREPLVPYMRSTWGMVAQVGNATWLDLAQPSPTGVSGQDVPPVSATAAAIPKKSGGKRPK